MEFNYFLPVNIVFGSGTLPVTISGNASLNISNFSLILKEKGAIPAFAVIAPLLVSYLFFYLFISWHYYNTILWYYYRHNTQGCCAAFIMAVSFKAKAILDRRNE